MKNSTKSKHSTESATDIKKTSRWFRISSHRGEIEQLFDLYWGGKERRITGLTVRIIGVNIIAVFGLLFGVIYLGQYHSTLVQSKLETFETEVFLVTAALTEGSLVYEDKEKTNKILSVEKTKNLTARLSATLNKRILIFDHNDHMIADSKILLEKEKIEPIFRVIKEQENRLDSVELLKSMAAWVISFLPLRDNIPHFIGINSDNAKDYPDVIDAKLKNLSISVWIDQEGDTILTAAMPIIDKSDVAGVVMLVNDGKDIKEALGDAWFDILKIFLVTLLITILLSIYLSGVIARPLRKLAVAAENVRKGRLKHTEIPDMSNRHDEIGELSIVLRDMTYALWERMDTIEAFAADVAHEIKNPLTSLKSAVETAAIVKNKEDRDKLLDIIRHDVERLDRLITDISKASRLDAELSRELFDEVDLKFLLGRLLDSYKNPLERDKNNNNELNKDQAVKNGVLIKLDLPEKENIIILGSDGRLIQVFQNIIENALSFSPIKSQIKISAEIENKRVTIIIDDEGIGIPDNKLKEIFERFYSERPDYEDYGRHSGLGLSICKQIITAHNGIIYAENRKDRSGEIIGARFITILNMK